MVTIEPFLYQKTTAFKERVQIISKLNEIIEVFNDARLDDFAQYVTETNERLDNFEQTINEYYTKEEIDELIDNIDLDNYYNKSEVNTLIATINSNFENYYNKTEVDTKFDSYYNKTEVDNKLTSYYTKTQVDNHLDEVHDEISSKQNTLIAGSNVNITNDVISATGGYNFTYKTSFPNNGYTRKIRYIIYKIDMSFMPIEFFITDFSGTVLVYPNKIWRKIADVTYDTTNNTITYTYIIFRTTGQSKIVEQQVVVNLANGSITATSSEKLTTYNPNNISSSYDYYVECYIDNNYPSKS